MGTEVSCNQWEGSACTQSALLFSFKFGVGAGQEEDFFHFSFLPNRFPMCSLKVLSISPCFNPICFGQSPSLFTYIVGPKGEALYHSIESSILGSLHSFNIVLWWADQIPQKEVGLVRGVAQAKIGGGLFWEQKFRVDNGKAQAHTQGA